MSNFGELFSEKGKIQMKKIIFISLLALAVMIPMEAAAKKKKDKFEKKQVTVERVTVKLPPEEVIAITSPAKQLYGEWNVDSIRKKPLSTTDRPYIYLDFDRKMFYGSNGCNTINGKFANNGVNMSFKDIISTSESCHNHNDRNMLKTLTEVARVQLTKTTGNLERMKLLNNKGALLMVLTRHNMDELNGAWTVKEMNNNNVLDQKINLVVDVALQTIHANTGCNIINGVIHIDATKDFAIQFEDLRSSENQCNKIGYETEMLLGLEQTEYYKRINDHEVAFMTKDGTTVIVLTKLDLKQLAKNKK